MGLLVVFNNIISNNGPKMCGKNISFRGMTIVPIKLYVFIGILFCI